MRVAPSQCDLRCFPGGGGVPVPSARCHPRCPFMAWPALRSPQGFRAPSPPQASPPPALSTGGPVDPTQNLWIQFARVCCMSHCPRPWALPSVRPAGFRPCELGRDFNFWASLYACLLGGGGRVSSAPEPTAEDAAVQVGEGAVTVTDPSLVHLSSLGGELEASRSFCVLVMASKEQ